MIAVQELTEGEEGGENMGTVAEGMLESSPPDSPHENRTA